MRNSFKKIPSYISGKGFKIHGLSTGINKAEIIKLIKSLIPMSARNTLYNKFAEQTKACVVQEKASLFKVIHIETRALCNGLCSFCPAAAQYKSRPDTYLPRDLYSKVIDELRQLNYRGRISPYCNNEPLIDERIYDFLNEAREKCPAAHLEIKTNGRSLDINKLQLLVDSGADSIYINDYQNTNDFGNNIKEIIYALLENKLDFQKCKIVIIWRKIKEILENRAGSSPNLPPLSVPLRRFCTRPFEMITVGSEGQIGICSSDFNFRHTVANIRDISLLNAWNSSEYQRIRESMLRNDRSCTVPCSKCDFHAYRPSDLKGIYQWIRWV